MHTQTSAIDYGALVDRIKRDGGLTISLVVSAPGHERRIPLRDFNAWQLRAYVSDHAYALTNPGRYLGAWIDNGTVYLDVSAVFSSHDTAVAMARSARQLAIFNLDTSTEERIEDGAAA